MVMQIKLLVLLLLSQQAVLQPGLLQSGLLQPGLLHPKERDKYNVSLMNRSSVILPHTQHKIIVLVVLTMFAVGF